MVDTNSTQDQFLQACQKLGMCVYLSLSFFIFELLRHILLTWSDEVH